MFSFKEIEFFFIFGCCLLHEKFTYCPQNNAFPTRVMGAAAPGSYDYVSCNTSVKRRFHWTLSSHFPWIHTSTMTTLKCR